MRCSYEVYEGHKNSSVVRRFFSDFFFVVVVCAQQYFTLERRPEPNDLVVSIHPAAGAIHNISSISHELVPALLSQVSLPWKVPLRYRRRERKGHLHRETEDDCRLREG